MTESLTFTRTTLLCDEVKGVTNFKPFVMFGGPNPSGTGGIQIFQWVSWLLVLMFYSLASQCRCWGNTLEG